MLAHSHAGCRDNCVAMVGRADGEGVDLVAHLREHFAEVEELLSFRPTDAGRGQALLVNIADCYHVAGSASVLRVAAPFARYADAGELDFLVGGPALAWGDAAERPISGPDGRGGLEKATSIRSACHVHAPCLISDECWLRNGQRHATFSAASCWICPGPLAYRSRSGNAINGCKWLVAVKGPSSRAVKSKAGLWRAQGYKYNRKSL